MDATNSDFARLDERVRKVEPLGTQINRVEAKVDDLHKALASLVRFEERQGSQAERVRELFDLVGSNRDQAEKRAAAMAERFDGRVTDLERAHQTLSSELHGYVQRYMGISAAVGGISILLGGIWTVFARFIPSHF